MEILLSLLFLLSLLVFLGATVTIIVRSIVFLVKNKPVWDVVTKNILGIMGASFILFAIVLIAMPTDETTQETANTEVVEVEKETETAEEQVEEKVSVEYKQALKQGESYLEFSSFSKQDLFDQLTSEYGGQFTDEEAQYAVDELFK